MLQCRQFSANPSVPWHIQVDITFENCGQLSFKLDDYPPTKNVLVLIIF